MRHVSRAVGKKDKEEEEENKTRLALACEVLVAYDLGLKALQVVHREAVLGQNAGQIYLRR